MRGCAKSTNDRCIMLNASPGAIEGLEGLTNEKSICRARRRVGELEAVCK